jgi:NAD(P)-dependent dehydrogenase (short-subunit alcohol dehydrogenase family)
MESTAIVTGGTGGLGATVVARLRNDDWRVVVPSIIEPVSGGAIPAYGRA